MAQSSSDQGFLYVVAVSALLQGILYGLSVYMFGVTFCNLLHHRPPSGRINRTMLTMTCLLFILSTMSMIIVIQRFLYAFVIHRNILDQPTVYFVGSWFSTFNRAVLLVQIVLGDAIVLYRCYIVWSSILILVLPALLFVSGIGLGIVTVWTWTKIETNPNILFSELGTHLTAGLFGSTLAGNAISTVLLAYKLWTVESQISQYRTTTNDLRRLAHVAINSGAIYSINLILFLSFYFSKSDVYFIMENLLSPITSICFYMVLLGARRKSSDEDLNTTNISLKFNTTQHVSRHKDVEIHLAREITVTDDSQPSNSLERRGGPMEDIIDN
ncbi:hypothetical protein H2248_008765 [Termitomyces sp. 'cryptogamus']|nr:hypothetical protein H2248_008765 [Termitomyces sp. 'cryptogamus']